MTPRGFRDVLPQEAAERDALVAAVAGAMCAWGYGRVDTPVVERLDVLEAGEGVGRDAFRLIDLDGSLLALRPEMTLPVARVVASRLATEPGPLRLRYAAPVLREHESLRGEARQFTQLGLELLGASGPAADAEIVAILVESLRTAGLEAPTVGIGTVAVLRALLAASEVDGMWRERVTAAAHSRNLVALDALAGEPGVPGAVGEALRAVPRIRGRREAIADARAYAAACGCAGALDELDTTWELLEAAGVADDVTVDFGVMRSFDYYTGLVIEAYAPGLGLPVGGGGRYDGLLASFGAPRPAAGFAIGLERLQIALAEQRGSPVAASAADVVLGGEGAALFAAARELRAGGMRVALAPGAAPAEVAEAAARAGASARVVAPDGTVTDAWAAR